MEERLYDKREVAVLLHCSVSKIEKMMRSGRITFIKIDTMVRFRPSDIEPFIAGSTSSPTPAQTRKDQNGVLENTRVYALIRARR